MSDRPKIAKNRDFYAKLRVNAVFSPEIAKTQFFVKNAIVRFLHFSTLAFITHAYY